MALTLELALTSLCWIRDVFFTQHLQLAGVKYTSQITIFAPLLGCKTHLKTRLLRRFEKGERYSNYCDLLAVRCTHTSPTSSSSGR